MACVLQNIQDPKLKKLIEENGTEDGTTKYLKEYAELNKQFGSKTPLSKNDIISLNNSLQEHNSNEGTNHSLVISDGTNEFIYGSKELSSSKKYTSSLNLDWGNSLNHNSEIMRSISPEDPTDADIAAFQRELNGEYTAEPNLSEYNIVDEDIDFSEEMVNQILGDPAGLHSGILQLLRQASIRTKDLRDRVAKLNLNINSIQGEITNLEKSGVDKSDERIISRLSRMSTIEDKVSEYYNAMKEFSHLFKATKDDLNIDRLKRLFDFHKEFSLRMATSNNAEAGDITIALDAMDMWSNIRPLVFDEGVNISENIMQVLQDIERQANDSTVNTIRARASQMIRDESLIPLTPSQTSYAHDVSMVRRGVRALADTSVKMLSSIDAWIKKANFLSNKEIVDKRNEISSMFKDLKKSGLSMDQFIDEKGNLVSRINNIYYSERQAMLDKFEQSVDNARNTTTGNVNPKLLEKALKERNEWVKSRTYIIDPSKLDTEQGRLSVKNELIKITGDASYSEDRIIDARMKYEQFQRYVIRKTEVLENQRKSGEIATDKELTEKIKNLTKFNSPIEYRKYINQNSITGDLRLSDNYDKYATEIPLRKYKAGSDTGYYNDTFNNTILNNPAAFKFYNDYTNTIQQMLAYLPSYAKKGLSESFLPSVYNSSWKTLTKNGITGFFSGAKNRMVNSFTSEAGQNNHYGQLDSSGNMKRTIPIKYMNKIDVADKSRDLEDIINKFSEMAITYKHISQVEDKVKLQMNILKGMKGLRSSPDGTTIEDENGPVKIQGDLKNSIAMAQHAIDNNFYGSRFEVEGFTNQKFFNKDKNTIKIIGSVNPIPILSRYNELVEKSGKEIADKRIQELYKDNVILINEKDAYKDLKDKLMDNDDNLDNGIITKEVHASREKIIMSTMNGMGRNLVISKGLDSLVQFSYLKSFAYNIFPAFANDVFGDIAIMNWASGRLDFNPKQGRWALVQARIAVMKAIKTSSVSENKFVNLAMKLNVVSDSTEGTAKDKSYNLNILSTFGFLSSGDNKNRMAVMAAYMRSQKINDLTGKSRELWDAFNNDGSWNVAEFGNRKGWNDVENNIEANSKLFGLSSKINRLNRAIHGNMDTETMPSVKRHVLGRLLSQYRLSWMVEGIADRFESKRYDEVLERNIEGKYITTFKYVKEKGIATGLSTMLKLMAFQGEAAFSGQRIKAEDKAMIIANVRRTLHEMYYYAGLCACYLALSASLDDDDENQKYKYVALNTIYRTMGDISFYFQPSTINQIINNPIPIFGIFNDFGRFTNDIRKNIAGDEYYDESIIFRDFVRQIPVLNMFPKMQYRSDKLLMNQSTF